MRGTSWKYQIQGVYLQLKPPTMFILILSLIIAITLSITGQYLHWKYYTKGESYQEHLIDYLTRILIGNLTLFAMITVFEICTVMGFAYIISLLI